MLIKVNPRMFHLPAWVVPHDVCERLAEESAKSENVRMYLRQGPLPDGSTTRFHVTSCGVGTWDNHNGQADWCWRHLTHDRKVELWWHMSDEPDGIDRRR